MILVSIQIYKSAKKHISTIVMYVYCDYNYSETSHTGKGHNPSTQVVQPTMQRCHFCEGNLSDMTEWNSSKSKLFKKIMERNDLKLVQFQDTLF